MSQYDYVDPKDKRLQNIKIEESSALNNSWDLYDEAIEESQKGYTDLIDKSNNWSEEQKKIATENTDFAIDQIEQNKEYLKQDMQKELSGAYTDWQKQSNPYGATAEVMASQGLQGSGYAESSKISMYNTWQNRVSTALESYRRAVTDYNIAIHEAKLQNSSLLAEIAYNALQNELSLTLQGMQDKNTLLIERANKELAIKQYYDSKWLEQYKLLMDEKKLEIANEQYQEEMAYKYAVLAQENKIANAQLNVFNNNNNNSTASKTVPTFERNVVGALSGLPDRKSDDAGISTSGAYVVRDSDGRKTHNIGGKELLALYKKGFAEKRANGGWELLVPTSFIDDLVTKETNKIYV